jgi:hypothetical protein
MAFHVRRIDYFSTTRKRRSRRSVAVRRQDNEAAVEGEGLQFDSKADSFLVRKGGADPGSGASRGGRSASQKVTRFCRIH